MDEYRILQLFFLLFLVWITWGVDHGGVLLKEDVCCVEWQLEVNYYYGLNDMTYQYMNIIIGVWVWEMQLHKEWYIWFLNNTWQEYDFIWILFVKILVITSSYSFICYSVVRNYFKFFYLKLNINNIWRKLIAMYKVNRLKLFLKFPQRDLRKNSFI